jgi:hypothetical protein
LAACDEYPGDEDTTFTFVSVTPDGSSTNTTTRLILEFSKAIPGLAVTDISLSDNTIVKESLLLTGTKVYSLGITVSKANTSVIVTVAKQGYTINGGPITTPVYYSSGSTTTVNFNNAISNTVAGTTTTALILEFNPGISLVAGDINFSGGTTGATKGSLSGSGNGQTWTLNISGVSSGGSVTVTIIKDGYTFNPASRQATVYYGSASGSVSFTGVTASSSTPGGTTTSLTLNFNASVPGGLTINDITLAGVSGLTPGSLSPNTSSSSYTLPISLQLGGGTLTVTVNKSGVITQSHTIEITRAINIVSVTVNGSISETTTTLNVSLSESITGLDETNIHFSSSSAGLGNVLKRQFNGGNPCTMEIYNFTGSGELTVSISRPGYTITPSNSSSNKVLIYYFPPVFTSIESFRVWLADVQTNIPENAYQVQLNLDNLGGDSSTSNSVGYHLKYYSSKYVNLNLSGCSFTDVESRVFEDCTSLVGITLHPTTVSAIRDNAFKGCTNLASMNLGGNITTIGASAFYNCTKLRSVTLGNRVTSIGDNTFSGCTTLNDINLVSATNLVTIGASAFNVCTSLSSIQIGNNVTSIGTSAFNGCTGLVSVTIAGAPPVGDPPADQRGTTISASAFYGCTSLLSIDISGNITSIGDRAFYNCTRLASVTFSQTAAPAPTTRITSIGDFAFANCSSLGTINIPVSVTRIGASAFINCTILTSLILTGSTPAAGPPVVTATTIGTSAFVNCTSLRSITFGPIPNPPPPPTIPPANAITFGNDAFPAGADLKTKYDNATTGGNGVYTRVTGSDTTWTKSP